MERTTKSDQQREQRAQDLLTVVRALYGAGLREESSERLDMLRLVAVELKQAIDEAGEADGTLHPDLGLELLLFIELKKDGSPEAETNRQEVVRILEELERN